MPPAVHRPRCGAPDRAGGRARTCRSAPRRPRDCGRPGARAPQAGRGAGTTGKADEAARAPRARPKRRRRVRDLSLRRGPGERGLRTRTRTAQPRARPPRSCASPGCDGDGGSRDGACGVGGAHRGAAWAPRVTGLAPRHEWYRGHRGEPHPLSRTPGAQSQRPRRASGFGVPPFPAVGGPRVPSFSASTRAKPNAPPAFLRVSEPKAEGSGGPCPHSPWSSSRLRGRGRRGPRSVPPHSTASELGRAGFGPRCPGCDRPPSAAVRTRPG